MNTRHRFLVGYDISDSRRRQRALHGVQHHALGGQKSFYECWLSVGELQALLAQLTSTIDQESDRVVCVRLDARHQGRQFGHAEPVAQTDYFYIA